MLLLISVNVMIVIVIPLLYLLLLLVSEGPLLLKGEEDEIGCGSRV